MDAGGQVVRHTAGQQLARLIVRRIRHKCLAPQADELIGLLNQRLTQQLLQHRARVNVTRYRPGQRLKRRFRPAHGQRFGQAASQRVTT